MQIAPRARHPGATPHPAEQLLDLMFATPKELRHKAEEVLGQLFVPTELVSESEHDADLVLRPAGLGEIHVHASRERHWYPYRITRIEHVDR